VDAVGVAPTHAQVSTTPFVTYEADAYCKGLRPAECRDAGISRGGKLPSPGFYAKSDVASKPWPRTGFEVLVEWMETRQRDRVLTPLQFSEGYNVGKILIEACDGAPNAVRPDATAYVHRDALFVSQYQARWQRENEPANLAWANGLYDAVAPYRSGFAYQDYIDPDLEDWQHAYYGANFARLREVKSRYDPDDFFRFARSIPPL
jgi:hypothetical protein